MSLSMKLQGWVRSTGLFLAIVFALGIANTESTNAQDKKAQLPYINSDADIVVSSHPSRLMRTDVYMQLKKHGGSTVDSMLERAVDSYFKYSLAEMEDIEQAIVANEIPDLKNMQEVDVESMYNVYVIRTKKENENGFDMVTQDVAATVTYKSKEYFELKEPIDYVYKYAFIADEKTIVWGTNKSSIERSIDAGANGPKSAEWYKSWQKHAAKSETWVIKPAMATGMLSSDQQELLGKFKFVTGGAKLGKVTTVVCDGECSDPNEAKEVAKELKGTLKLASQFLTSQKDRLDQQVGFVHDVGQDLIKSAKLKAVGKRVELKASFKLDLKKIGKQLAKTNEAVKRTTAANNLRQTALSILNFESAYAKFPNPVMVHPETGKKYSWRIAILPFIEENAIYEKYDFSQDWDSPHNMEVTSKMPDVFRSDMDDKDSTNTSWFMLTGAEGIFGKPDVSYRDLTDGTSNTILAVESKRSVHWSKPEDIEVDPERPFPKLGGFHEGGINVVLADGSVQFLPEKIAEKTLWKMYTASGGEVIDHNNPMIDEGGD